MQFIGADVYISDNIEIKRPHLVKIGNHVAIDSYNYWTTQVEIGNYVHISPFVSIIGGKDSKVIIGNFCTLSCGVRLICASDNMLGDGLVGPLIPNEYRDTVSIGTIKIKDFCSIGTNAVIMPNVTIGMGAVIAANSFVKQDIPQWEIWGGNPIRFIKKRKSDKMIQYAKEIGYELE